MDSFFAGIEFVPMTAADRAADRVGRVYRGGATSGAHTFEIVGSDGEYVFAKQLDGGVFKGETFRWHVSSLNGMVCVKH